MKKSTHNGTCQVCGSEQALPGGVLAKHGYTVEHGWFEGTCPGSGHKPLENDRAFADEVAASLRLQSRDESRKSDDVRVGVTVPVKAWSGRYVKVPSKYCGTTMERELVPYAEAAEQYQREAVAVQARKHEQLSKLAASTADDIVKRAEAVHGKLLLRPRAADASKKVIGPGTVVRLGGAKGFDVTVLRVEDRVARGCGPHLNGQYIPHIVWKRDTGSEASYPVRLIRQSAIIE